MFFIPIVVLFIIRETVLYSSIYKLSHILTLS